MSATQEEAIKMMLQNYVAQTNQALALDEKDPEQIKRRLKIIRGLTFPPTVRLEVLDELAPVLCFELAKEYNRMAQDKINTNEPLTPANFFLTTATKSPYTFDIVPKQYGFEIDGVRFSSKQSHSQ